MDELAEWLERRRQAHAKEGDIRDHTCPACRGASILLSGYYCATCEKYGLVSRETYIRFKVYGV